MIEKKSWKEFKDSGFLWWANQILHTFGWAIVFEYDKETEKVVDVYPARVKFRGFDEATTTKGYQNVSRFMKEHAEELEKEANE